MHIHHDYLVEHQRTAGCRRPYVPCPLYSKSKRAFALYIHVPTPNHTIITWFKTKRCAVVAREKKFRNSITVPILRAQNRFIIHKCTSAETFGHNHIINPQSAKHLHGTKNLHETRNSAWTKWTPKAWNSKHGTSSITEPQNTTSAEAQSHEHKTQIKHQGGSAVVTRVSSLFLPKLA